MLGSPRPVRRRQFLAGIGIAIAIVMATVAFVTTAGASPVAKQWPSGGQNLSDTHSNPFESTLTTSNVGSLVVKWTFAPSGDVSATPAIVNGVAYFPDWGGYLNAVQTSTGTLLWRQPISAYDGVAGAHSRTSPAVANGVVYIGDQNGAHLIAVKAKTGRLIWSTQLDTHPSAIITQSPLVDKGVVYEGVSSSEQAAAANPSYPCCTFRGSMTAVKASTGAIVWKTYMVPSNGGEPGGYSGGAVWSSTPALDPATKTLYITTGNNYTIPASASTCETDGGTPAQCLDPTNYIDAIVAINATTGAVKWADDEGGFDAWTEACTPGGNPSCPNPGPDADFGSGAQLLTIKGPSGRRELVVGAGQKSGTYWEADATTGHILWGTQVGPGGSLGGMEWGSATDGNRIYVAEADSNKVSYTPVGSTQSITSGSWAALNPVTGAIIWQTPDPSAGVDIGAVSTANGVVYAGSLSGYMYAINAATGSVLWDYQGQGSSIAGPAIVNGVVYWGNGYDHLGSGVGTGSTTFYAFALPSAGDRHTLR